MYIRFEEAIYFWKAARYYGEERLSQGFIAVWVK
jgi:hypothetical protein